MAIITLPREAVKEMNDRYVKIEISEEKLTGMRLNWEVLEATRGLLNHYRIDPLEYQKKCREEWDR